MIEYWTAGRLNRRTTELYRMEDKIYIAGRTEYWTGPENIAQIVYIYGAISLQ